MYTYIACSWSGGKNDLKLSRHKPVKLLRYMRNLNIIKAFSVAQGLGGLSKFTLVAMPGMDKVRERV